MRMIEPLPNARSICDIAASNALLLSLCGGAASLAISCLRAIMLPF